MNFNLIYTVLINNFLGRHSLMARPQDTVSDFWRKKRDLPMFLVTFPPFFFICIIFKKEGTAGEPRRWDTAGRVNIGDVGL